MAGKTKSRATNHKPATKHPPSNRRLNLIMEEFLFFASNRPMPHPVLPADFLEDIVRLMSQKANAKNITIESKGYPADIEMENEIGTTLF